MSASVKKDDSSAVNPFDLQYERFRLESLSKRRIVFVFLGFFFAVGICVLIGLFGPTPYITCPSSGWQNNPVSTTSNTTTFSHEVTNLKKWNGEWWFYLQPTPTPGLSFGDQVLEISVDVRSASSASATDFDLLSSGTYNHTFNCIAGVCNKILLGGNYFITNDYMVFNVSITCSNKFSNFPTRFDSSNYEFMVFQASFRYVFMALTAVVLSIYLVILRKINIAMCTEEKFVIFMLILVALYDNPFFIGAAFVRSWLFLVVDVIATVSFICGLLLVILVFTHRVLLRGEQQRRVVFYGPKLVLVGAIWILNVAMLIYVRLRQVHDPSNADWASTKPYQAYFAMCAILVDVYLLWLLILIWKIARASHSLSYHAKRFRFMWFLTIIVILFTAACIFLYVFNVYNAAEFLAMYGVYNFYCYVMAYLFAPSSHRASETNGARMRIPDRDPDEFDVEMPSTA